MSHPTWFRIALLTALLASCARSSSLEEIDDDDDAGFVDIDDDDAGNGGLRDASADGATIGDGGHQGGDGGSITDGGSDADPVHPCEGVTCNTPPANTCADALNLRVYEPVGVCDEGKCLYDSTVQACPGGCAQGACVDNPCAGVTCNTPPDSHCKNESYLTVYSGPGVCSSGNCSYTSQDQYCAFGCIDDVCNGNPCLGVVCNTPPADFCSGPNTLFIYKSAGTCSPLDLSPHCTYTKQTEIHCEHGCVNGSCAGDPCAGKSCNTPPANLCKDAFTAIQYQNGSCSEGACDYPSTEVACPFGCENGFCKDCAVNGDCGTGKYCNAGVCSSCNVDLHCGDACENCAASGSVCFQGACIQCMSDDQCGPGRYCSGNTCFDCNTAQKCGASCTACSGKTPVCNGNACVCDATSCGSNQQCVGGSCSVCKSDSACGSTCSPCGGDTPFCLDQGSSSKCVECRNDNHCAQDEVCNDGVCGPACSPTPVAVFSDAFATPNTSGWTTGTDAVVSTSRWRAYTNAKHGVRVYDGRLEITNKTSGSPTHGHGYAYVKTGGEGSAYDNTQYEPVLSANVGREVIWTLNMRRSDPGGEWGTEGGFDCSSSSSQNGRTLGMAYVLATDSAGGLNASASTCNASASGSGYAVVFGGNRKIRLVRFTNGLRNGTITNLVESGNFTNRDDYFSVRVTYNANTNQWKLEARRDGTSSFQNPASGSYSFTGTQTDATYVNVPLQYSGPYFQTGCSGLCGETYQAYFDNVTVSTKCAP